jgi:hypothetical protein
MGRVDRGRVGRDRMVPGRGSPRPAPAALMAVAALVACLFAAPLAYLALRG